MQTAGPDEAMLILRLYELRRDERMREAREFLFRGYSADSIEDHAALCPAGSRNDASFRMVVAYWDMACSFVIAGILNEELLVKNNAEMLLVWARIQAVVPPIRMFLKDPTMWQSFELVAKSGIESMKRWTPGSFETRMETIWKPNRAAAASAN